MTIGENLGSPEYSYYFVVKSYMPILRKLGIVITVNDPGEVDAIYRNAAEFGQPCVFFSFAPPHHTRLDLACPTIPVFAWEFETIPNEVWDDDPRNDWRYVFSKLGRAITHSNFTVASVRAEMGPDFPIVSIPSPMWDNSARLRAASGPARPPGAATLELTAAFVDSRTVDLRPFSRLMPPAPSVIADSIAPIEPLSVSGVIYTAVFNPEDGRKNWFDMVCAFCLAFQKVKDATLVLKLTHYDTATVATHILYALYKLTPFKCRVVVVRGYLDNEDYENLIKSSTYVLNTSSGEGQCLPLMEFMSCGIPAVSSRHTAMLDYVNEDNSFVVKADEDVSSWPHDWRRAVRTLTYRVNIESLMAQFTESYRVAKRDPDRYARMSECAWATMRDHCSEAVALERLRGFLASSNVPGFC